MQLYHGLPPPDHLHDNLHDTIYASGIVLLIVPTITVALRFWARLIRSDTKLWWDDWLLLIALIFSNALIIEFLVEASIALGRHVEAVAPENVVKYLKIVYSTGIMCIVVQVFYKAAAIFLYLRVFGRIRVFTIASLAVLTLTVLYTIISIFVYAFACDPVAKVWSDVPGHCLNILKYLIGISVVNVVIDIMILLLPMPMIHKLNLTKSQKVWLSFVFLIGYCVVVVPLVRLGLIIKNTWILDPAGDPDFSWNSTELDYSVYIEGPVAIIGLCLPPIFQLMNRWREHGLASLFRSDLSKTTTEKSHTTPSQLESHSGSSL